MVRFKNRWLLVHFIPLNSLSPTIDPKQIAAALRQSALTNFGDTGWGAISQSLTVKYYSPTTHICIIRVARDHHRTAWAALTLLSSIEGVSYIPNVLHVSGTIRHAQLAAITHNREAIARYRAQMKTPPAYQDSYDTYLEESTRQIEALHD